MEIIIKFLEYGIGIGLGLGAILVIIYIIAQILSLENKK